jgi:hypothetical protein
MSINSSLAVGSDGSLFETGWKDIYLGDYGGPPPNPHPMCRCDIGMDFGGSSFTAVGIYDVRGDFIRSIPMEVYKCPPHLAKWALNYIRQEKVHNFIKRLKTRLKTFPNASKRS